MENGWDKDWPVLDMNRSRILPPCKPKFINQPPLRRNSGESTGSKPNFCWKIIVLADKKLQSTLLFGIHLVPSFQNFWIMWYETQDKKSHIHTQSAVFAMNSIIYITFICRITQIKGQSTNTHTHEENTKPTKINRKGTCLTWTPSETKDKQTYFFILE